MPGFWKRLRPFSLIMTGLVVGMPWELKFYKVFNSTPSMWLMWAGCVFIAVGWMIACYWHDYREARGEGRPETFVWIAIALGVIGLPAIFLSDTIYSQARLAIQRDAMQRYVEAGEVCPAMRCVREGVVVAFVWGEEGPTWSGVCYDPADVVAEAEAAWLVDRAAKRPRQPRLFGGVVTIAKPIGAPWRLCTVSKYRLGEPPS